MRYFPLLLSAGIALFTVPAAAAIGGRLVTAVMATWDEEELRFEEEATPAVMELGLHRDGVMPIGR